MARRAFIAKLLQISQAAPRIWNDLPIENRNSVTLDRLRSALRTDHYYSF